MASITTKYSIGDVVYLDEPQQVEKQLPCPDCLDQKKWKALSPAGTEYEFGCPRCSGVYKSADELSLKYQQFVAHATELTIGSVRVDTNDPKELVSYMCKETGVGSGSVYRESELHPTREWAERASAEKANARNTNPDDFILPLYNKRLDLSAFQLKQVTKPPIPRRKKC